MSETRIDIEKLKGNNIKQRTPDFVLDWYGRVVPQGTERDVGVEYGARVREVSGGNDREVKRPVSSKEGGVLVCVRTSLSRFVTCENRGERDL